MPRDHWDYRFLALAEHVSTWSKDPSTGTGCILVRPDRSVASLGYNGFPRGVYDDHFARLSNREAKLAFTVHAEPNAILAARASVEGCTAYVHPWPPCSGCAALLIQAGIVRVVSPRPTSEQLERWGESMRYAEIMLSEAQVDLVLVEDPLDD